MDKILTVAILGCGGRGKCYSSYMKNQPDKFKVVALCDLIQAKLDFSANRLNIPQENCFLDENEFFKEKRADLLVLSTPDRQHVRQALKALELGYDILLEKPISSDKKELEELLAAQKRTGKLVLVCHVLRYSPTFNKVKELLDQGAIGDLRLIESIEQVSWWHQSHSFVRGNSRNEKLQSSMIMQKCCHDLDLIQNYAGARCKTVYSVGDLSFFNKKNKPENTPDNCGTCRLKHTCPYSAEYSYIVRWKEKGSPENQWPFNFLTNDYPLTEEKLRTAYENGPYGRCVFSCDNDVVDNQHVSMTFENGVKAMLTMTAFTAGHGRIMTFHGTHGEIKFYGDDRPDAVHLLQFGKDPVIFTVDDLVSGGTGYDHGGGDYMLVKQLYDMIIGNKKATTSLEASIESHLIAIAAEESRKTGLPVNIKHDD